MQTSLFTSRFSFGPVFAMMGAAVVSAAFSWYAKCHWQVESEFFGEALRISERYAQGLRINNHRLCIIFGGSTSRSSYIPSVLFDQYGIPAVNFGLHAGFGRDIITEIAMSEARKGDTVVIALEPDYFTARTDPPIPSGGIDFFLYVRGISFRRNAFFSLSPMRFPDFFFGNTRYNLFQTMKRIRRMKPYRYVASENLHDDGWMEVFERRHFPRSDASASLRTPRLGSAGRSLLLRIRNECERRGCRVVLQIPPRLDDNPNARLRYAMLVRDILPILPVVKDPLLGINPHADEFADTPQHPLRTGALRATHSFGEAFANGRFWTESEIDAVIGRSRYGDRIEAALEAHEEE